MIRTGALNRESAKPEDGDQLPSSVNKWRLVSMDMLRLLTNAVAPEGADQWGKIRNKQTLLDVLGMGLQVDTLGAVPSKSKQQLYEWSMRRHAECGALLRTMVVSEGEVNWEQSGHFRLTEVYPSPGVQAVGIKHAASGKYTVLPQDLAMLQVDWILVDNHHFSKASLQSGEKGIVKVLCVNIFATMQVALEPPMWKSS